MSRWIVLEEGEGRRNWAVVEAGTPEEAAEEYLAGAGTSSRLYAFPEASGDLVSLQVSATISRRAK